MNMRCVIVGWAVLGACLFGASDVLAWGSTGHRLIAAEALRELPADTPALLRSAEMIEDVSEWAREPDRWRLAGTPHDEIRDVNHFAYADDDGRLGGGPTFASLPATREAFAQAVRKAGGDPERVGYLPYAILDAWQQVGKDFAYWRADRAGLKWSHDPRALAWLEGDKRRRESQLAFDIGVLAHYVGDATQPMHLSIHHDGWGDGPNPDGFSLEKGHVRYEGPYTASVATAESVRTAMSAPHALGPPAQAVGAYLDAGAKEARIWFALEKAGAFTPGDVRGARYTTARLAVAASMLRDMIAAAWSASATGQVNYPIVSVRDLEAGKADAYLGLRPAD